MPFYFCSQLNGEEGLVGLLFIVFLVSCDSQCSVALPRGAVGLSAVCDLNAFQ